MSRNRLFNLCVFTLGLGCLISGVAHAADPGLMGYWKLDGDAQDSSGNNRHGTLHGNPQFGEGIFGQALEFDGVDDYVNIDGFKGVAGPNPWSIGVWFKATSTGERRNILNWGSAANGTRVEIRTHHTVFDMRANSGSGNVTTASLFDDFEWHHLVVTAQGNATASYPTVTLYFDGQDDSEPTTDADTWIPGSDVDLSIGRRSTHNDRYWEGALDEVVMYDRVLTPEEVVAIMEGDIVPPTGAATGETPTNEATDVPHDVTLSWSPGPFAATHNVYMGTVFDDVNNASTDLLLSQDQSTNTLDVGTLTFDQTYYWRVDEVNAAPDKTVFPGKVWNFTVEPIAVPVQPVTATASGFNPGMEPTKTIDGSGLNEQDQHSITGPDMWLSGPTSPAWIQYEFDQTYKLHAVQVWNSNQLIEPLIGFGAKDVSIETSTDGESWTTLEGISPLAQATGRDTYTANTTVDLGGTMARFVRINVVSAYGFTGQAGLSEVRFLAIPTVAREPQPTTGAMVDSAEITLAWRAGREAADHQVLLGIDPNDLTELGTVTASQIDTGALSYATTYYWSVTEVNQAATPAEHTGDTWSFTTPDYAIVDDFETYSGQEGKEVFLSWFDGFGGDASLGGSTTGHIEGPFVETAIVKHGGQSLPIFYANDGSFFDIDGKSSSPTFSEVLRELTPAQDWSASDIKTLSLFFRGDPANSGQLYLKINGTRVNYDGDPADIQQPQWLAWNIDLTAIGAVNKVRDLAIGIDGAGAKGVLYIDSIRLYPQAGEMITPVEPDAANLIAQYTFEGNGNDSVGGLNATLMGGPTFVPGKQGQAIRLNGNIVEDYVEITGYKGILGANAFTIALWVNTLETIEQQIVYYGTHVNTQRCELRVHSDGHIRMGNGGGQVQGFTDVTDGNWHHVTVTVIENATNSSSDVRIYVDGLEDTQEATDPDAYDIIADWDVTIGYRPSQDDRYFLGQMDDLRIYDRTLSPAEVAGLAGRTADVHKSF
jgi:hypothetical protein